MKTRVLKGILLLPILLSPGFSTALAPPQQRTPSIVVDVDVVLVSVTVTDSRNRFVQGLQKEDFRIWEDRIEQEISSFSTEDSPVSLGIVLDRSGSMGERQNTLLNDARSTAYSCLTERLRNDEFFLIEFSNQSQVVADFTTDIWKLRDKLLFTSPGGRTALWDAIYLGVSKLEAATHSRRGLLVLSDGLENRSRYTLSDLKGLVREREVRIYGTAIDEVQFSGMDQLAELTGGRVFRSNNPCQELAADLKNQYLIGYQPTNRAADGAWRDIRVRVESRNLPRALGNLSVRARAGYHGKSNGDPKADKFAR